MKVYDINEIEADEYYTLQKFMYGQWMYCNEYAAIKGSDISAALEKEAKYANPADKEEWRIVDCSED